MQMTIINYSPPRQDAQFKLALININKQSTEPRVDMKEPLNLSLSLYNKLQMIDIVLLLSTIPSPLHCIV